MSQQPPHGAPDEQPQQPQQPYGQQPYGQQPPQYPPYGAQGGYPNPYAQMPQQSNNTTRNVLLIVGVVIVLFCGGLIALGLLAINNVSDEFEDAFDNEYVGSEDDPIVVTEGEAFTIRGFDYEQGWSFASDPTGAEAIIGLRATNDRDDGESARASLVFTLLDANEVVDEITCYGGVSVRKGRSVTLECSPTFEALGSFEEIEVHDTAYYE